MERKPLIGLAVAGLAGLALAGCGGTSGTSGSGSPSSSTSSSPVAQIRAIDAQGIQAIVNKNPDGMCPLTNAPGTCVEALVLAKAMGYDATHLAAAIPADWRSRLAAATVTISGNTATVSSAVGGDPQKFVNQNGHWLMVQANPS